MINLIDRFFRNNLQNDERKNIVKYWKIYCNLQTKAIILGIDEEEQKLSQKCWKIFENYAKKYYSSVKVTCFKKLTDIDPILKLLTSSTTKLAEEENIIRIMGDSSTSLETKRRIWSCWQQAGLVDKERKCPV